MQIIAIIHLYSLLLALVIFPYNIHSEEPLESKVAAQPPWMTDERIVFQMLSTNSLTSVDGGDTDDVTWKMWAENINQLAFSKHIKTIRLTSHFVSAGEMEYFCGFENVETFYVGHSIEGVTILPDSLQFLPKLKKLRTLYISIQGLSDKHLEILDSLPDLEDLIIEPPSLHMLYEPKQYSNWRLAQLSDVSLKRISSIRNLVEFILYPIALEDGEFTFTSEGFLSLLQAPKLKYLKIHHDGIIDSFLKAVSSMTNLKSVSLISNELTDVGLKESKGISIESLELRSDQFTDTSLKIIGKFGQVSKLSVYSPLFSHEAAIELLKVRNFEDTFVVTKDHFIQSFVTNKSVLKKK